MSNKRRDLLRKRKREMRWDRERTRKQMAKDARERMVAEAYTRDLARGKPDVPEKTKKEMRAELELLGVAGDTPLVPAKLKEKPQWSAWRTVMRPDGSTYQERDCHHPGRETAELYDSKGVPW